MSDDDIDVENAFADLSGDTSTPAEQDTAPDDLDALLAEFETTNDTSPKPSADDATDETQRSGELDEALAYVHQQKEREHAQIVESDIANAVGYVDAELTRLDIAVPAAEATIRGRLLDRYRADPYFRESFDHRYENVGLWQSEMRRTVRDLKGEYRHQIDPEATADRAAIAAAVRGASVGPMDNEDVPTDIASWSNARFEKWVASQGR